MITQVPHFDTALSFNYTLTPTPEGWQLTVWEEAEVTEQRVCPFLWKFRVELSTLTQAQSTLEAILADEHKAREFREKKKKSRKNSESL